MSINQENVLLKIENLNVHYGDLQALHDVSLNIKKGSVVSIIGSNGAGKSTLLNAVTGIHKPTSGKITHKGVDITGLPTYKIISQGISMSPEGSRTFQKMSVKENLLMGAYLPRARKKKDEMLEKVYTLFPILKEKELQLATFLSGGQRQILAIGRAIMSDPEIIICDEISLGLAPVIIKEIYCALKAINEDGMTFVLVEQDVKRSLKHSDYSYIIVKGRIVMEGPSSELPEDEVKDAYFGVNRYA